MTEPERLSPEQFNRFRDFIYRQSGIRVDASRITLVSNRIRECNRRLRSGQGLETAPHLLEELNALSAARTPVTAIRPAAVPAPVGGPPPEVATAPPAARRDAAETQAVLRALERFRIAIQFERDLPLADLKAELALARIAEIATILETRPSRAALEQVTELRRCEILLTSDRPPSELRGAADVDGVELVEIDVVATGFVLPDAAPTVTAVDEGEPSAGLNLAASGGPGEEGPSIPPVLDSALASSPPAAAGGDVADSHSPKVAETVRVEISRLDNLMNLAGELVVNKARFIQIARQMQPAFRKSRLSESARTLGDSLRRTVETLRSREDPLTPDDRGERLRQLGALSAGRPVRACAWIAGGANMFGLANPANSIGFQNTQAVERLLDGLRIPIAGRHCGGEQGRRMTLELATGAVTIDIVGAETITL